MKKSACSQGYLYIHRTALEALDLLLRVYEGCARAYLGEIEGANLVKLHRHSGKVSYLTYPDFDADPHPALLRSIKLNLRTREIESSDYASSANPPVLHRKEAFLLPDDPRLGKFERPTRPGGAGRAAGRDRDDRHAGRLGRAAAGAGICPAGASARAGAVAEKLVAATLQSSIGAWIGELGNEGLGTSRLRMRRAACFSMVAARFGLWALRVPGTRMASPYFCTIERMKALEGLVLSRSMRQRNF